MGLDTVELVMAFEEAFEIDIPDEAAERIYTVRDVIDYVYSRVEHADAKLCLSQRTFYRLRRSVQETLGVERSRVRPSTSWESLLPVERRQQHWMLLKAAVGADKWPALERSADARRLMMAFVFGCAAITFVAAPYYKLQMALSAAVLSAALSLRLSERWRIHFPHHNATVGQIAETLTSNLPSAWRPATKGWTREQVRAVVRQITIEHLNVDPSFDDDASFVDDLGAD